VPSSWWATWGQGQPVIALGSDIDGIPRASQILDLWAAGEEHQEEFAAEWGWDNLLPYFKKSVTFEPPTDEMVEAYNITYDVEAAYGGTTPIYSSYRPFHWPSTSKSHQITLDE
jgi:hypothetical protein